MTIDDAIADLTERVKGAYAGGSDSREEAFG